MCLATDRCASSHIYPLLVYFEGVLAFGFRFLRASRDSSSLPTNSHLAYSVSQLRVLSSETYGLLSEIDAHGGMATALFIDRYRSNCVLTGGMHHKRRYSLRAKCAIPLTNLFLLRHFLSVGVDGKLKVWNLDLSQSVLSGPRKGKARKASCGAKKRAEMRAEVSLHFELNHGTKINSICISRKGETSSGIWAVADVTNVISLYSP